MRNPICPYCKKPMEEFDQPDDMLRLCCCSCKILVTIEDLVDDFEEICQGPGNMED